MQKFILTFFLMFLSFNSFSKVNQGEAVTAKRFNESTFGVGDIKHSLLTESQFQNQFGNCWVKMTGQDVSGSDYASITGNNTLPNSTGRFLRDTGGESNSLGNTQEDTLQNITGDFLTRDDNSSSYYVRIKETNGAFYTENVTGNMFNSVGSSSGQTSPGKVKFDASRVARTSNETRPKNLSVNYFLKINYECN